MKPFHCKALNSLRCPCRQKGINLLGLRRTTQRRPRAYSGNILPCSVPFIAHNYNQDDGCKGVSDDCTGNSHGINTDRRYNENIMYLLYFHSYIPTTQSDRIATYAPLDVTTVAMNVLLLSY